VQHHVLAVTGVSRVDQHVGTAQHHLAVGPALAGQGLALRMHHAAFGRLAGLHRKGAGVDRAAVSPGA
jgi:RimJ/RimL family protein N-acetyltransferase